jgi:hypothetical protein
MRPLLVACACLAWSSCLLREEAGIEPASSEAGCGRQCEDGGTAEAGLGEELERVVEALAATRWVGSAVSGSSRLSVAFEFERNGDYTARCLDEDADIACRLLFLASEDGVLRGRYGLYRDKLHGAFHGWFEDLDGSWVIRSDLSDLTIEGNTLEFTRRAPSVSFGPDAGTTTGSLVFSDARMVLERTP